MRMPHSLKSTHWLTWSSPLLLLVLVFTLTASSSPPRVTAIRSITATTPVVTTRDSSTTTIPPARAFPAMNPTTSTTLTIRPPSTVPTTNAPHASFSSSEIASNVGPVANARAVNTTNGALSGQLRPSFEVADVPLEGPGTWSITTSSPARTTMQCDNHVARVQTQIVVGSKETCQLIIAGVTPATSITWQLTPVT